MNPHRGGEIYEKGIYDIGMTIKNDYGNIPWFISENGMGVEGEEKFADAETVSYKMTTVLNLSKDIYLGYTKPLKKVLTVLATIYGPLSIVGLGLMRIKTVTDFIASTSSKMVNEFQNKVVFGWPM